MEKPLATTDHAAGRTALIAGASGLVGSRLLSRLLGDARYDAVKVLTRRPLPQRHAKLVVLEIPESRYDALGDALAADDVYCCLGATTNQDFEPVDYQLVLDLARAARNSGARQFIVLSALGTAHRSPLHYFRVKARMEQAVSALGYDAVHLIRPSLLLGDRAQAGTGERIAFGLAGALAPLLAGTLKKYRPVSAADVATAMIAVAMRNRRGAQVHYLPLESGHSTTV